MRLLLDQNLSHRLVDYLADIFPGSTQARLVGLDRATDAELWAYALREDYAIVSRDVDLAEMAVLRGAPPLVIWLRGGNSATTAVEAALRAHHADIVAAAVDGQVACVEVI